MKYYIYLNDEKFEVSKEIYNTYYKSREKERYFMKTKKKGKIKIEEEKIIFEKSREDSLERLIECNVQIADDFNLEDFILMATMIEKLNKALSMFTYEENYIIEKIYFYGKSRRNLAKEIGISHTVISKKERKILNKIKKLLKN